MGCWAHALSNNRAERSIKPFVIFRKNFLFANTAKGARSSAVIFSLIETAKEKGLDPYRYLFVEYGYSSNRKKFVCTFEPLGGTAYNNGNAISKRETK